MNSKSTNVMSGIEGEQLTHGECGEQCFFEEIAMKSKQMWRGLSRFKLSTDPASVEATTDQLKRDHNNFKKTLHRPCVGGSSDFRAMFFLRTAYLAVQSLLPPTQGRWRANRIPQRVVCSDPVVASTDARSVESVPNLPVFYRLAVQSLLPPTQGRWRARRISQRVVCSDPVVASTDARSVESFFGLRVLRATDLSRRRILQNATCFYSDLLASDTKRASLQKQGV